jgi:hypothetical protein
MQARGTGRRWALEARKAVMFSMSWRCVFTYTTDAGAPSSQESEENQEKPGLSTPRPAEAGEHCTLLAPLREAIPSRRSVHSRGAMHLEDSRLVSAGNCRKYVSRQGAKDAKSRWELRPVVSRRGLLRRGSRSIIIWPRSFVRIPQLRYALECRPAIGLAMVATGWFHRLNA